MEPRDLFAARPIAESLRCTNHGLSGSDLTGCQEVIAKEEIEEPKIQEPEVPLGVHYITR